MLRKPSPGDGWFPSADRERQIAEAVNWVQANRRSSRDTPGSAYDTGRCLVSNGTCDHFRLYDAVQIDSPITFPADSEPTGETSIPTYRVITPETTNSRIAILVEPVVRCAMGRAIASGQARTKINVVNEAHRWAKTVPGSRRLVSTNDSTAPCEIIWKEAGTGIKFADVLLSLRRTAPLSTAEPGAGPIDIQTNPCSGRCKFVWHTSVNQWFKIEEESSCGVAATTTGTTFTSTTLEGTTTPCCPFPARESDIPIATPTSTTGEGTTTAEAECDCLWPTFCGTEQGQCTYTDCVRGAVNQPPVCGGTTTGEGTTTCDCENTEFPPLCTAGCDWVGLPTGGGAWRWHWARNGCTSGCPCPRPTTDPFCNTAHTNCEIPPGPPTPPGPPPCEGSCVFWWIPAISDYFLTSNGCTGGTAGCYCVPPSNPGSECAPYLVPCVAPSAPQTTGEAPEPPPFDPCVYWCYGIDPPATTTTTQELTCDTAECVWKSDAEGVSWISFSDECPQDCPCQEPRRAPLDDCEIAAGICGSTPPTTTGTSTSTTGTTTSGLGACCCPDAFDQENPEETFAKCYDVGQAVCEAEPSACSWTAGQTCMQLYGCEGTNCCGTTTTTTTTRECGNPCDEPDAGYLMWRCLVAGPSQWAWNVVGGNCPLGASAPEPAELCDGTTYCVCAATQCTTTTTTTTTTCELTCEDLGGVGPNQSWWLCVYGSRSLCDADCPAGYTPREPTGSCQEDGCEFQLGDCQQTSTTVTSTTSTTTPELGACCYWNVGAGQVICDWGSTEQACLENVQGTWYAGVTCDPWPCGTSTTTTTTLEGTTTMCDGMFATYKCDYDDEFVIGWQPRADCPPNTYQPGFSCTGCGFEELGQWCCDPCVD